MGRRSRRTEQVIVVTGASSGLGRAVARAAGGRGAKVVVAARGTDGLEACVHEIEAAGSQAPPHLLETHGTFVSIQSALA